MTLNILKDINSYKNEEKIKIYSRFFKTGSGEYGEGDQFLGLSVPETRNISKKYKDVDFSILEKLICNKYHEVRLFVLLVLVLKYKKAIKEKDVKSRKQIVDFYLKNILHVNNWDLVDLSSYHILGEYCFVNKNEKILINLLKSKKLWKERIAIISTFYFIRQNDFSLTLYFAKYFLNHKHDLIQKACGWMLREIGKRDIKVLRNFLNENYQKMPRTMLRYSIEKLEESERKKYLKK